MAQYNLLDENVTSVPDSWFQARLDRISGEDGALQTLLASEVEALKLFHTGHLSTDDAAKSITQPITDSPVPHLGTYSDESAALAHLWALLIEALVEWPSSQTPSLVALLKAIKESPGNIHRGQATDDEEKPLSWGSLPHFTRVWSDNHWMSPGQIARRCPDDAALHRARAQYVKQQDVEAQLVAAQLFAKGPLTFPRALQYVAQTLERTPGPDDRQDLPDDASADGQLRLDFRVPAASRWIHHCGQRLHDILRGNETASWDPRDIPASPVAFDDSYGRWRFWEERLLALAKEEQDEATHEGAESALGYMRGILNG
ncbi:hypothetical protein diail_3537 [Diaporthe ilicicola]|nr:hypothetical protein diail_3537 [Diaporthe ilicicola]